MTLTLKVINFYNKNEPYYEFANFFDSPIYLDKQEWRTTEHFFQAMKFLGSPLVEEVNIFFPW
jgi:N-glycosidase YbiA